MEVGVQAYREAMADINIDKVADTMDEFRDVSIRCNSGGLHCALGNCQSSTSC